MNRGLRFYLLIILCCILITLYLSTQTGHAVVDKSSDPDYIFYKGNTMYEEGKYDGAIREYSRLLEQGFESGNIYYNIGNCYFKKGDIGRAILNYERAKRLIPGDSDLSSNYKYARSLIKGNISKAPTPWFRRISDKFDFFTINGLTIFLSVEFVFTVFLLLSGLFIRSLKRYCRYVLLVLLVIFVAGAFSLYSRVSLLGREAVIISESADAKFEPLDNATTYFTVHEGMKVYLFQSKKDWNKIKRADGKVGWIRTQEIEKI